MKIVLKYKSVVLCMIAVFAMGIVVFNYNMQAKLTEKYEHSDLLNHSYRYESTILIAPTPELYNDTINYVQYLIEGMTGFSNDPINISLIDINAKIDKYGTYSLADMHILGYESKFDFISGNYPTKEQIDGKERYVVLGRNREQYVYNEGGKQYIDLNGETYEVAGFISTGRSHYLDNELIIFDKNYEGKQWNDINDQIKMGGVQIVFESDTIELGNIVSEFQRNISIISQETLTANLLSDTENLRITSSYTPNIQYRRWAWLAYGFSIITTLFMCQYWIICRKKEFAIKKACGFSTFQIMKQFFTQTLGIMLIGVMIGVTVIFVNGGLAEGFVNFDMEMFRYMVMIIFGYICVTFCLLSVYLIVWLSHAPSIRLLNGKKGTA